MATVNVRTWEELVYELRSAYDNEVINITANLDANGSHAEVIQIPEDLPNDENRQVNGLIIEGNGHTVFNVQNPSGTTSILFRVMNGNSDITINDLNFENCLFGGYGHRMFYVGASHTTLNNCVIQGRFDDVIMQGGGGVFNNCMITNNRGSCHIGYEPSFKNCWIKFDKMVITPTGAVNCLAIRNIDTCYITGKLTIDTHLENPQIFRNVKNSCINIDITITESPTTSLSNFVLDNGEYINVINKDKIHVTDLAGWTDTAWTKMVTTEQMQDSEYLADTGFLIVP